LLTRLAAREIAARVQRGELQAVDVVDAHLQRIAQRDPQIGALSTVRRTQALDEARQLQQRGDLAQLPLAGVPVVIKENTDVAGLPTLYGSAGTSRKPAAADDELVRRLRAAGAIPIAKSHMSELAIWPMTESPICFARNPLDVKRTPGGSSGGSAAAVAAGMAPLALGSDGGGSIRIPSACCGLVGIKPTPGLVPLPGDAPSHWYGLSVAGPIARDVDDAALMLDVLSATERFAAAAQGEPRLRVTVSTKHPVAGARVNAHVEKAVRDSAAKLRTLGHDVEEDDPPYPVLPTSFLRCWMAGIAEDAETLGLDVERVEPRTRALIKRGQWLRDHHFVRNANTYEDAVKLRTWMSSRDVLVAPILAGPPPAVGRWWGLGWIRTMLAAANWMGFAPPWNLAGCPAIALPAGRMPDDFPVAVQLVGPPQSETTLIAVPRQL
jgi:amidase